MKLICDILSNLLSYFEPGVAQLYPFTSGSTHLRARVEILKTASSFQLPDCEPQTIIPITRPVRKSKEADYEDKWKFFLGFVPNKDLGFKSIKKGKVLRFLSHLFHTKRLKPSRISHYRSTLPLSPC